MAPPPGLVRFAAPLVCGIAVGWAVGQWQAPAIPTPAAKAADPLTAQRASINPLGRADQQGSFEPVQAEAVGMEVDASNIAEAVRGALSLMDPIDILIRVREIMRSLSAEEIPAAIEQIRQLPPNEQWQFTNALGARWAEVDLEGALKTCQANRGDSRYNGLLMGAVNKWTLTEPQAALAWVKGLPQGQQQQLFQTVAMAMTRSNPQAAFELINSDAGLPQNAWLAENLFSQWYVRDRSAALAAFSQLNGNLSSRAVQGLADVMANEDPAAAAAWANGIPDKTVRNTALIQVAQQWSNGDPAAALNWARDFEDPDLRTRTMGPAIRMIAMRDFSAAKAVLDSIPSGQEKDTATMWAAEALRGSDNSAALELLFTMPDSPTRKDAVSRVCSSWAAADPQAALDWLFQNDAARAGDHYVAGALSHWSQRNPDQATAWVNQIADPAKRDIAMSNLVSGLASSDPVRAKQLFSSVSPENQGPAAVSLTSALASRDLENARAWAESLPPGRAQNAALGVIASQMVSKDPAAAAQWIEKLPTGAGRDKAVANFADHVVNRDPEAALEWAVTISNPAERSRKLDDLGARWFRFDSDKARKWIQANPNLTPADRQRLLDR